MITQRDLAGIPISQARGAVEPPAHPELPAAVAILAEHLGGPLLRVTLRLTALASQAPPPLRAQLLAQVEEIDELIHTARQLLLPAAGGAPDNSAAIGDPSGVNSAGAGALGCGVGEPVGVGTRFDDQAGEGEPVDDGCAEPRVGERARPTGERLI